MNHTVGTVLRALPSGWIVVAGENVTARVWLTVLATVGVLALPCALAWWWSHLIDRAFYAEPVGGTKPARRPRPASGLPAGSRPASGLPAESTARATGSPTWTVLRTEARLLVTDPPRVAMLMMPAIFVVLGVALLFSGSDVYGMAYGAPLVVFISGTVFFNAYALDRLVVAVLITSPHAGPIVVRARQILAAALATVSGVVGVAVGSPDPDTLPIALAVLVAVVGAVAACVPAIPSLAPYRIPPGAGISALSSRGSMSSASIGYSLVAILVTVVIVAPGVILALVLDGPVAYTGVVVSAVLAIASTVFGNRIGRSLLRSRGPEIYAAVA